MTPPTVYLIKRGLTDEQLEQLREHLALTPLEAVLVTSLQDLEQAGKLTEKHATALTRPIAIIGDFEADFAELGDNTTWHSLPSPSKAL